MPKVSVIIPVYNVEKYLTRCLQSVCGQTMKDIEIICINDGSTDNSLQILQEYAQQDNRIKIISQRNKGVSSAKNKGLRGATGKYLTFIDSDDYLSENALESAVSALDKNTDILLFGSFIEKNNKNKPMWDSQLLKKFNALMSPLPFSPELIRIFSNVWAKLYRKDFLTQNNILFPDGIKTAEDAIFNIKALLSKPKCKFLSKYLYHYRVSGNQTMSNRARCLISDIEAFKYLENEKIYQNTCRQNKLIIIDKFINGILFHVSHLSQSYAPTVDHFISYLSQKYGKEDIAKLTRGKKYKFSPLERLFCIYDSPTRKYKIYQIFGIKIKMKRMK